MNFGIDLGGGNHSVHDSNSKRLVYARKYHLAHYIHDIMVRGPDDHEETNETQEIEY